MVSQTTVDLERAVATASAVVDPEIPVMTIADLGVLQDVSVDSGEVVVTITPTYSGCPAMAQIEDDIVAAFRRVGEKARVQLRHHPAWSTDLITDEGRRKLAEFGIAPPGPRHEVLCPRCDSGGPRMVSLFGSTACKALMACSKCGEPFDYFKEF